MKIIIDTDPGIDDAMAIFHAAAAPEIDLIGLTTIFGNVTVETATRNAQRLNEMTGMNVPVAAGAGHPLVVPAVKPSSHVHGAEGFGDIPAAAPEGVPLDESAAEFLVRMASEHAGELVVCAIGPATNIAQAIQLDPNFARNVSRIVLMGGAAFVPGNITKFAEANTWHDPHALNAVFSSGADVLMVGLDLTMQVLCTADDFAELARNSPRHGGFLKDASDFYLRFYVETSGIEGCGLHDPAAVIACTHPELFEIIEQRLYVVESGPEIGRTKPCDAPEGWPVKVCIGGDIPAIKARFMETVSRNP